MGSGEVPETSPAAVGPRFAFTRALDNHNCGYYLPLFLTSQAESKQDTSQEGEGEKGEMKASRAKPGGGAVFADACPLQPGC